MSIHWFAFLKYVSKIAEKANSFSASRFHFQNCRNIVVPSRAFTRHHGEFSVMGTPSFQPFLKSYWLTPVKWVANCREVCTSHANTDKLRGSIKCGARDNYVRIFSFTLLNNLDLWLINYYSSQLRFAHQRAVSVWPLLCSVQVSMMFFLRWVRLPSISGGPGLWWWAHAD